MTTTPPSLLAPRDRNGRGTTPIWGVIGGVGPLASGAFVQTIYDACAGWPEQAMPIVWLASDPGFPDRTAALLAGDAGPLTERLITRLDELLSLGADRIVICCMTMHAMLPRVPDRLRARVVSLVDVVLAAAIAASGPSLLLCTHGARHARIYESSPRWAQASPRIILPEPRDQRRVHDLIYELKRAAPRSSQIALVDELVAAYGAAGMIAGCTELHLLCRATRGAAATAGHWASAIDPLTLVADRIVAGTRAMPSVGVHEAS